MKKTVAILFLALVSCLVYGETDIVVKGLFKNGAIAEINGKQRMLKVGRRSPEGVLLISADSQKAVAEVDGERRELVLDQRIGGTYAEPERAEVRIARGDNSHYYTPGRINNRPVNFVVDTGASSIAMHTQQAKALGIQYLRGKVMLVGTANGTTEAYKITLNNVSVGDVVVHNVEAVVMEGMSPDYILLGNSYLSRVEMKVDSGVLVLQAKF